MRERTRDDFRINMEHACSVTTCTVKYRGRRIYSSGSKDSISYMGNLVKGAQLTINGVIHRINDVYTRRADEIDRIIEADQKAFCEREALNI